MKVRKYIQSIAWLGLSVGLLAACQQNSANQQAEFYVRGNCGMCKERIEETVKAVDGVSKAVWSGKDKMLSISYDSTKVNELQLHQVVAASGHETKLATSPDDVHDALPECCKKGGSM
jgi:mercuric ion binding protein